MTSQSLPTSALLDDLASERGAAAARTAAEDACAGVTYFLYDVWRWVWTGTVDRSDGRGFVLGAEKGGSGDGVKRAKEGSLASRSSLEMTGLRPDTAVEVLRVRKRTLRMTVSLEC